MNPAHRYIPPAPSVLEFVAKISKYVDVTFKTNLGFLGGGKKDQLTIYSLWQRNKIMTN